MSESWGWAGSVAEFLVQDTGQVLEALGQHHGSLLGVGASATQTDAWLEEINTLKRSLTSLVGRRADASSWGLVLEYELPREAGRRPDAVLLGPNSLAVLEFKSDWAVQRAYVDQVDAYARDLSEYHSASHSLEVTPILVLPRGERSDDSVYGVTCTNAAGLADVLERVERDDRSALIPDLDEWLNAEYAPLPSLVVAARRIFQHEALPSIRRAESSGVNEAVNYLRDVAERASRDGGMHLALVAGVPGAGKTLVGLRFVYESHFADESEQPAVFLSGNGPLVQVLQHTLSSEGREGRVFVRDVHAFLKRYGGSSNRLPHEHMWVMDEAQRAWDVEKVREKRPESYSEPEDFLRVGEKLGDWALMIGLIGEGQEIHVGEESGLPQWNEALTHVDHPWAVHCPMRVGSIFSNAAALHPTESLDLTLTLRSHRAAQVCDWVTELLGGRLEEARQLALQLKSAAFSPLVTRNETAARRYAEHRYADAPDARFGMMISSQRKWSSRYGFIDDFYLKPGPWFADPYHSPYSCRRLERAVTEFQCQGLELDLPLIGWGGDLLWQDGWYVPSGVRKRVKDPFGITQNVYRVLLTRGRDGFVVFVPPRAELDGVFNSLQLAGCDALDTVVV